MNKLFRFVTRGTRKLVTKPGDAFMICRMAWWVAVLSVAARLTSLPRALELVAGRRAASSDANRNSKEQLAQTIDLLLSADVLMFRPICWKRATVLHRYLLKQGVETQIIFGVRNATDGKIDGHAWLEYEGKPILEKSPPEYVVTYSFPSKRPFNAGVTTFSHD